MNKEDCKLCSADCSGTIFSDNSFYNSYYNGTYEHISHIAYVNKKPMWVEVVHDKIMINIAKKNVHYINKLLKTYTYYCDSLTIDFLEKLVLKIIKYDEIS